ncbi:MAG: sigma-70 family RNA polymerase sigma factor, partial [Clostridiales bacterium]|nr:sigma-70 family RNA polymerase sigma factor [Clostridiales bacterium]
MKARGGGQLKEHLLSNDEEFLRIYNNNKNTVFGIAFNYTKSNSDANDILQDVFVKFFISKK